MICPYCNKEMKLGTIEADNLLSWTPEGERPKGATRWSISPNGIKLANFYFFRSASIEAYYCSDCQKIILDVPSTK